MSFGLFAARSSLSLSCFVTCRYILTLKSFHQKILVILLFLFYSRKNATWFIWIRKYFLCKGSIHIAFVFTFRSTHQYNECNTFGTVVSLFSICSMLWLSCCGIFFLFSYRFCCANKFKKLLQFQSMNMRSTAFIQFHEHISCMKLVLLNLKRKLCTWSFFLRRNCDKWQTWEVTITQFLSHFSSIYFER